MCIFQVCEDQFGSEVLIETYRQFCGSRQLVFEQIFELGFVARIYPLLGLGVKIVSLWSAEGRRQPNLAIWRLPVQNPISNAFHLDAESTALEDAKPCTCSFY